MFACTSFLILKEILFLKISKIISLTCFTFWVKTFITHKLNLVWTYPDFYLYFQMKSAQFYEKRNAMALDQLQGSWWTVCKRKREIFMKARIKHNKIYPCSQPWLISCEKKDTRSCTDSLSTETIYQTGKRIWNCSKYFFRNYQGLMSKI